MPKDERISIRPAKGKGHWELWATGSSMEYNPLTKFSRSVQKRNGKHTYFKWDNKKGWIETER